MKRDGDILVVDDDPDMADTIVLVLEDAGYQVRSVANGRLALDAVATRQPALILLDMLMPVMDGWQCTRELRSLYGTALPIVAVTAAEHARARTREIDVDDLLPKPFEVDDLLRVVERYVAQA